MKVGYSCGHTVTLVTAHEVPPKGEPWTLYPLIDEHPIDIGDVMTCIVCKRIETITSVHDELIPVDDCADPLCLNWTVNGHYPHEKESQR